MINELVCEGCGDCSVQSNCISIEPIETEFGRKRRINQSSCNKDYSCLKGYCPSFVTRRRRERAQGEPRGRRTGRRRALRGAAAARRSPTRERPWNVLVTGIGGTGVVTVGAILADGRAPRGQGLLGARRDRPRAEERRRSTSHVRIARDPGDLHATRIASGGADLLLGCDIVVATSPENLPKLGAGRSVAVVNSHVAPTAEFASAPGPRPVARDAMEDTIRRGRRRGRVALPRRDARSRRRCSATRSATNLFLLGYAFQLGRVPVSLAALRARDRAERPRRRMEQARASRGGASPRTIAPRSSAAARPLLRGGRGAEGRDARGARRAARRVPDRATRTPRWARALSRARRARRRARARRSATGATTLARAVARYLFKLMAYKDEYEVARLYTDGSFRAPARARVRGRLPPRDPPLAAVPARLPGAARPRDRARQEVGDAGAADARRLPRDGGAALPARHALDPFGWTAHRRLERRLIARVRGDARRAARGPHGREPAARGRDREPARARARLRHA